MKFYEDRKFWIYVMVAAVIAGIMIISTLYEIDWVSAIQSWIYR